MRFVDQRTFGGLHVDDLVDDGAGGCVPASVRHIARDPLDPLFDRDRTIRTLRERRTEIKRALLDQGLVSGIGNIYADEALWRARLHGRRMTQNLTRRSVDDVLTHVTEVMHEALEQGGTSFDALYVNVNGQSGYFSRSLNAYGREGEPCARCGSPIRRACGTPTT
jgi:formamidopyrimidine-DNA glycosylase